MPDWAFARRVRLSAVEWISFATLVKSVAGLAVGAYVLGPAIHVLFVLHVLAFGSAGAYLVLAGGRDDRARRLGAFFAAIAASFANGVIAKAGVGSDAPSGAIIPLVGFQPEAFLPLVLWQFVTCFPIVRRLGRSQPIERTFIRLSIAAGVICFAASALTFYAADWLGPVWIAFIGHFAWGFENTWYWPILFGLALPALPFAVWKARRAEALERRRVSAFVLALLIGFLPILVEVLLEAASATYRDFITVAYRSRAAAFVLYPLLLSIPFTTAYAIRVNRVLDISLVIRRTVQYAFARVTIVVAAAVPVAAFIVSAVRYRSEPLDVLVTGEHSASVLLTLIVAMVALGVRRPLLHAIDRRFFVVQLDTRKVLQELAATTANASHVQDACAAVGESLRTTLHACTATVLIPDGAQAALVSGSGATRPLPMGSSLAQTLVVAPDPIVTDLERPAPLVTALSEAEKQWLADVQAHVLIPLHAGDRFAGVLVLGEKISGLPFTRADLADLAPVASALALAVENARWRSDRTNPEPAENLDRPARVCSRCFAIPAHEANRCDRCGGALTQAQLPPVLSGKFVLQREIGRGGMGVVYEALDVSLQRRVAIKTLPRVTASQSVKLHREARTMASFIHPNLATIFGMETWKGAPAVVMELLDGGTLAWRLRRGPLSAEETIHLTAALVPAIELIHEAGFLHRDIKPSNIGFTRSGVPKLLDFGLAQMFEVAANGGTRPRRAAIRVGDATTRSESAWLAGTPGYMAPEVFRGEPLDAASDLWSLGVVLYEALAGTNPFQHPPSLVEARIPHSVPDIRLAVPGCPTQLAEIVSELLATNSRQRPSNARIVADRLRDCESAVATQAASIAWR